MLAEMTKLIVDDPTTVVVVIYFMATVLLIVSLLDMRKIIWYIYPTIKGRVKGFRFDGPASGYDGELYTVAVDYEVNGVMHSKDVDYTEVIVSSGTPKYLPGDTIYLKRSPISGNLRTVEAVRYDSYYPMKSIVFTIVGIAILIGAIKFHIFANENFVNGNTTYIEKGTTQFIIKLIFGIVFAFPSGAILVTELVLLFNKLKIKSDFKSGKYYPITTEMTGYSVRRKKVRRDKSHIIRYYYYPYFKFEMNNEVRLVISKIAKYHSDIALIGKKATCFKKNDSNIVLAYSGNEISILDNIFQIIVCGVAFVFIMIVMFGVTI